MSGRPAADAAAERGVLPAAAFAATLAGLARMTVPRLGALLAHLAPEDAFEVVAGAPAPRGTVVAKILDVDGLRQTWIDGVRARPPAAVWERCVQLGVTVSYLGQPDHPTAAATEPLAAPVLDVGDVLLALSLDHSRTIPALSEQRVAPRPADMGVYRVCARGPATIGEIAELAGVDLLSAAMSLARLEQRGWLVQVDGWYESVGSPPR